MSITTTVVVKKRNKEEERRRSAVDNWQGKAEDGSGMRNWEEKGRVHGASAARPA